MSSAYTKNQLNEFMKLIEIPSKYHLHNDPPRDLDFLTVLHTHMLSTVPYENLSLHYSTDHKIALEPQHLYRKIVEDGRGRGGYCMENSLLYNEILKFTVDLLIQFNVDLCVLHISGEHNTIANCLSCGLLPQAQALRPALSILCYQPPNPLVEAVSL